MQKITMSVPIVEMDGDEMTRIIWRMIKEELIYPFIDLKSEYYDLGLANRDKTDDDVTIQAAQAIKKYGVGVKCATITPNKQRMEEYSLKKLYKSPNATIRAALDGTVFRSPIIAKGIEPTVSCWKKPITIARHAYGDVYSAVELKAEKGAVKLTSQDLCVTVHEFCGEGVALAMHNTSNSIRSFAHSCFKYALATKQDLWFGAKDTILKTYDGEFKKIFEEIYNSEYKARFEQSGITYKYMLIDDIAARVMRSEGGFIWACKNYDGDVMSDMVASAFGSLAMMTSVLVSPDGYYEYEAAHGTVTRHYYRYLKGEKPSTNPVATIFAWTGALKRRGIMDGNGELCAFAERMEKATLEVIAKGRMTGDLAAISTLNDAQTLTTEEFIFAVRENYEKSLTEATVESL